MTVRNEVFSFATKPQENSTAKILVIEDDVDIRHVICVFLQLSGFEVREALVGRLATSGPDSRPHVVPFVFAEVRLPKAPPGRTPRLRSRLLQGLTSLGTQLEVDCAAVHIPTVTAPTTTSTPPRPSAAAATSAPITPRAAARGWTLAELDLDQRAELAGEVLAELVTPEQRAGWTAATRTTIVPEIRGSCPCWRCGWRTFGRRRTFDPLVAADASITPRTRGWRLPQTPRRTRR